MNIALSELPTLLSGPFATFSQAFAEDFLADHPSLTRFNRRPKPDARPLIVMQAMGPLGFVFEFQDSEGYALLPEAFVFPTLGNLSAARLAEIVAAIQRARITVIPVDGDGSAGAVGRRTVVVKRLWTIKINQNHDAATQLVTLAHELAHLFLGHLGADDALWVKLWPCRR